MNFPKPSPGLINCVSCKAFNVKGCEECRRCEHHCGCICKPCWNCTPTALTEGGRKWVGNPVKHHPKYFCQMCGKCRRRNGEGFTKHECNCRKRPSSSETTIFHDGFKFNPLERPLGLEIEASYVGTTQLRVPGYVKYQWTHDGSITSGGQELVLSPLVGENFVRGVTALAEEFAKYEFQVDQTCGFHVHVGTDIREILKNGKLGDIRVGWGPEELRRLILLYYKFEDVFYALVQSGRDELRTNARGERKCYCARWDRTPDWYGALVACKTSHDIRRHIMAWLYGRVLVPVVRNTVDSAGRIVGVEHPELGHPNMPRIREHKYENCRYFGLNLHTWFQRGTVEYRHHEGTLALNKLLYWPLWCGWFTELASVMTDREVIQISSLDELLEIELKRPFKLTMIPVYVKEWVRETLASRNRKPRINQI